MSDVYDIDFSPEWKFRTSRSGGKGGQNVNKVETRVELVFDIPNSALLSLEEKALLLVSLFSRLSGEGILAVASGAERSQLGNKQRVIRRFYEILEKGLKIQKERKATRPSRAVKERRLEEKKRTSEKKENRRFSL